MINLHFHLVTLLLSALIISNHAFPSDGINSKLDAKHYLKVVGGADAVVGQFPWQVSLRSSDNNKHFCGGSIITSKWILTAAHCFIGISVENIVIVTGSISLSKGGNTHKISRIISHPNFNSNTVINDIALIQLESDVDFNPSVQPIELEAGDVKVVECSVSGWGTTSYMGPIPDNLQFVKLKTISNFECWLRLRWSEQSVTSNNVCTLTRYGEGACHGDSGGPLVADGKLIGIVSWGNPCAVESPDVYTRVSSYIGWINSNIRGV